MSEIANTNTNVAKCIRCALIGRCAVFGIVICQNRGCARFASDLRSMETESRDQALARTDADRRAWERCGDELD